MTIKTLKNRVIFAVLPLIPLGAYGVIKFFLTEPIPYEDIPNGYDILGVLLIVMVALFLSSFLMMLLIFPKYRNSLSADFRHKAYRLFSVYLFFLMLAWVLVAYNVAETLSRVLDSFFIDFQGPVIAMIGINAIQIIGVLLIQQFKVRFKWDWLQKGLLMVTGMTFIALLVMVIRPSSMTAYINSFWLSRINYIVGGENQYGGVSFKTLFIIGSFLIRVLSLRVKPAV